MRNSIICRKKVLAEDLCSVDTGEVPGLGSRMEDLLSGGGVDGQVVNGFVDGEMGAFGFRLFGEWRFR